MKNNPRTLMSMLQYPLDHFLVRIPSCVETSTLAVVLEIFEREQCDRMVIINQQQCPIGLLSSASLIPKLLATANGEQTISHLQQPLSNLPTNTILPIQTILATENLDKFCLCLNHPTHQNHLDWVLIDSEGKFLGVVDYLRLLSCLTPEKITPKHHQNLDQIETNTHTTSNPWQFSSPASPNQPSPALHQPLIQLLETLPWPLMLQTDTGEVVTQNSAWWEQLGILKDPQGLKQQVESILSSPIQTKEPEYATAPAIKFHPHQHNYCPSEENSWRVKNEAISQRDLETANNPLPTSAENNSFTRCYLDSHLGTCTCVVEVQNGQERVWQFAKIPLDSPELKVLSSDSEVIFKSEDSRVNTENLWLVLVTDVTEQQQLCKELAAKNADLMQLNRLKDEFLACISHELKTPLTAVLGLSRLLVDQQLGKLNERQARYAGLIHQSGRHLMSVVNDILDLTRMETGQMELMLAPLKIRAVCERALLEVKALHNQTSKTGHVSTHESEPGAEHQFNLVIEPGLEQMVADELRLRQMLVHLLSNAFKFTEISGEIGLRVSHWEGWIAFTIWDTGIGIPEHQQHLIFQKFQQLENPLTRQFEGTGLGLVLTRALARLHGGDVSFLSREGKGSQFTLLLPPSPPKICFAESEAGNSDSWELSNLSQELPQSPHQKLTSTAQHHPISSQRLVLVVESVARYIEDLTEHLKSLGYRVVIARSGTEAVEKARRLQPKAIFLNPLLPLLSGWDVLTLLKSDSAIRHIPIIVTATGAEKEQAYSNRADGFLTLPIEHQVLAPLLEKLCTTPFVQKLEPEKNHITLTKKPLRILRLVNPELTSVHPHSSLREHRVIEVDDLDQAELLARVWQFDVVLLDVESSTAQNYLQQLTQHPRLAAIPLVTCDVATTLAASQIPGLSVFPYLTPPNQENQTRSEKTDPLLSVLQIASGFCCPASILVVDLTMLWDLPQIKRKPGKGSRSERNSSFPDAMHQLNQETTTTERGSEWFQALIQYLQTAGFKAAMARCWTEVLQQIRHQSIDLLLIYLDESANQKEVRKAIKGLRDLPLDLPPILVLDQRLNQHHQQSLPQSSQNGNESIESIVNTLVDLTGGIATQILPRDLSMEDLLSHINQALIGNREQGTGNRE